MVLQADVVKKAIEVATTRAPVPPIFAKTPAERRTRVLQLYHQWLKEAPIAATNHHLTVSVPSLRAAIRQRFEEHRGLSDPKTIDLLVFHSRKDLEEVHRIWSQPTHLYRFFTLDEERANRKKLGGFLGRFLQGKE